jgi:hypothetical protein
MKIKLQKTEARKVLQILAKEKKQLKNNLKVTKESSFPSEEQREKVLLRQEAEVKEIDVIIEKFECEIFVNG